MKIHYLFKVYICWVYIKPSNIILIVMKQAEHLEKLFKFYFHCLKVSKFLPITELHLPPMQDADSSI